MSTLKPTPVTEMEDKSVSDKERYTGPEQLDVEYEAVPHLHIKTFLIVLSVVVVYFAQVFQLVATGAYNRVVAASIGGAQDAIWLNSITAIMTVALSLPFAQAADYWGRRWFLIIPTFCGVIGSIILARANSMRTAIAGDVILSISYGAQPLLHAVASEVLTHRNRAGAQAAINVGSAMGGVTGLLAGAALTRSGSPNGFRNVWYCVGACYLLGTILCLVLYNPPPRETQLNLTFREKLQRLDWIGYILIPSALVLFVMGLTWGLNPYPWNDAHVLGPILVGAFFVAITVLYEWKFKKDGVVHHGLFSRDRNFAIALGCVFVEGFVFFASNAYFPYQVSVVYRPDVVMSSLNFAVAFIVYAVACQAPAIYCYKTKRLRLPVMFAFSCFLAFNICMSTTTVGSGRAVWGYPVFLGCGLAVALCGLVTAAQLSAPPELIATTSGLMVASRSFGGAVGLGVYTAIFNSKLSDTLGNNIAAAALPLGLPASSLPALIGDLATSNTKALAEIPGITPEIIQASVRALLQSFVNSFRGVWITAACLAATGLFASAFLFDPIKDFNLHIDAPAEKEEDLYGKK